jgi:hypothetical protein
MGKSILITYHKYVPASQTNTSLKFECGEERTRVGDSLLGKVLYKKIWELGPSVRDKEKKLIALSPAEHIAALVILGPLAVVVVVVAGLAHRHGQEGVPENATARVNLWSHLERNSFVKFEAFQSYGASKNKQTVAKLVEQSTN